MLGVLVHLFPSMFHQQEKKGIEMITLEITFMKRWLRKMVLLSFLKIHGRKDKFL